jgi:hypothetical protein
MRLTFCVSRFANEAHVSYSSALGVSRSVAGDLSAEALAKEDDGVIDVHGVSYT